MKQNWWKFQRWARPALAGLGMLAAANIALAAVPDRILGQFDENANGWGKAWGSATAVWDNTQDATGNGLGSCYIAGDFGGAADGSTLTVHGMIEGNPWWHPTGTNFNLSDYKSLEFDIKWDSDHSTLSIADFNTPPKGGEGGIIIWSANQGLSGAPTLGNIQVPAAAATGWAHISLPINKTIAGIDPSYGIALKKWVASDSRVLGNTFAFWVDNVILKGDAPPPNPTLSLEKPMPGLALIAASGGQWDRQNIVTVGTNYNWLGASGPVTYSFTVAKHADTDHPGFQVHMYFVPGLTNATDSGPDYGQTNVFLWQMGNNADGTAWSALRYKTNAPGSNGHLFDTGGLGGPGSSTVVGTWTLTIDQNSNITATSPSGTTLTTNLPPEVLPYMQGNMQVYFGAIPGSPDRIGQMAILTKAKITGAAGPDINSDFLTQSVDTNLWMILGNGKYGVQTIPTDSAYWVNWTLPAQGFHLEVSDKLPSSSWNGTLPAGFDLGSKHIALVSKTNLPAGNQAYLRLNKRPFTKLQVLLPGETAAPGTLTGKTGTPLPRLAGEPFNIIVNAVDDFWFPITTAPNDSIALTTTDTWAPPVDNVTLSNGTCTFSTFLFAQEGTWTITVTDATDATKKANTSAPVVNTYQ